MSKLDPYTLEAAAKICDARARAYRELLKKNFGTTAWGIQHAVETAEADARDIRALKGTTK